MSTTSIIIIAVAVIILAGLGVVLTTARRSEVRGAGSLSRETRKKDRGKVDPEALTGREVESAALAARTTAIVAAPKAEVAPWSPPDPEAIGVSRRQFFNRASITLMTASLGAFGAAVLAFLWRGAEGGFGSKVNAGKVKLDEFNVLWQSPLTPQDPFVYRNTLCDDLKNKIAGTFLTVDQAEDGRKYLANVKSEKAVVMTDKDYDIVREAQKK